MGSPLDWIPRSRILKCKRIRAGVEKLRGNNYIGGPCSHNLRAPRLLAVENSGARSIIVCVLKASMSSIIVTTVARSFIFLNAVFLLLESSWGSSVILVTGTCSLLSVGPPSLASTTSTLLFVLRLFLISVLLPPTLALSIVSSSPVVLSLVGTV